MNTMLAKLLGKNETNKCEVLFVKKEHSKIYDKYYQYYLEQEYTPEDSDLIASLFEQSTFDAEVRFPSIDALRQKGNLCLFCLNGNTAIYCHDENGEVVEYHNISLETGILLHKQDIVTFERTSRHFLEWYLLV